MGRVGASAAVTTVAESSTRSDSSEPVIPVHVRLALLTDAAASGMAAVAAMTGTDHAAVFMTLRRLKVLLGVLSGRDSRSVIGSP